MNNSPNIHVGILKAESIYFKLSGKFNISDTNTTLYNDCKATIADKKIIITTPNGNYQFADEVVFLPCNLTADSFVLHNVVIGINFHWEQNEDQKFQGALKLIIVDNEIQAINIIPIENYLFSVISSEMNANSSLDLLKAHAIISRGWLLAQINKHKELVENKSSYALIQETEDEYIRWYDREDHTNFHVCADDHCQRYQGITRAHTSNVIKAVSETRGKVLFYNDKICDARFSKSCGGVSELFENCWEPVAHPYLTKVIDNKNPPVGFAMDLTVEQNAEKFINGNPEAFCNTHDKKILNQVLNNYDLAAKDFYRWTVTYTQQEIRNLIEKKSGHNFGKIRNLIPVERGVSGRLIKLKIVGEKRTLTVGKELEIRRWLSESHLYSSAFTIEKIGNNEYPEKFILHGAGWGHGVGLCQIGAAVMGEKGYRYDQILFHYFKNTEIKEAY